MSLMHKKVRKAGSRYAIGYGSPPTSSQFRPGQSGNPKGRPKGARNVGSMARDALERKVDVKMNGTWRRMSVREASYCRLADGAASGDFKSLAYLLSLESDETPPGSDQAGAQTSVKDLELLQSFFDRRRARVLQEVQPGARQQLRADRAKEKN